MFRVERIERNWILVLNKSMTLSAKIYSSFFINGLLFSSGPECIANRKWKPDRSEDSKLDGWSKWPYSASRFRFYWRTVSFLQRKDSGACGARERSWYVDSSRFQHIAGHLPKNITKYVLFYVYILWLYDSLIAVEL